MQQVERREWFKALASDVRMVVVTEGRPFARYVVRLEVLLQDDRWHVVHLFDNAHGRHDEHRYEHDAKQPAREFFVGGSDSALPKAVSLLDEEWESIIRRWRREGDD